MIKVVRNVKNHLSALIKNQDFVELYDVEDNSVIFYVNVPDEIEVGVEAQPDGEYLFADGKKIIIEGGKVKEVVLPEIEEEQVVEEPVTEEPVNEEIPAEEPVVETDLEAENEELKKQVEELTAMIEKLTKSNEEKEAELVEAVDTLKQVQNFYSSVNKQVENPVVETPAGETKSKFRIIK